jgi:hypothetical protein
MRTDVLTHSITEGIDMRTTVAAKDPVDAGGGIHLAMKLGSFEATSSKYVNSTYI